MLRRILLTMIALATLTTANAQDVKQLYKEGKALYDAKNYEQAFPKLKTAAVKGHKKAQYRLGRCFEKGRGVAENGQTAFLWYSKSAAQGYAKAQYQVGECYKDGIGVKKDWTKAFTWYMRAAKQDYANAQYRVGKCYLKGKGTTADVKKAKAWLSKAVKNVEGGEEILQKLKKKASQGDEDARSLLDLL